MARLTIIQTARNIVGDGSLAPPRLNASLISILQRRRKSRNLESQIDHSPTPHPKKVAREVDIPKICAAILIIFENDTGVLMLFMSLLVMANYAMLVPLQDVMRRQYGFNDLQVGLCYIPFEIGSIIGAEIVGKLLNWNYARVARSVGISADHKKGRDWEIFPIESAKLDLMWPWTVLAVAMIVAWGWVVDSGTNVAAPLVILFSAGAGVSGPV